MKNSPLLQVAVVALTAFCVGFWIADDSAQLATLSAQIAELKLAAAKRASTRTVVIPALPRPHQDNEGPKDAREPNPPDPWQEFLHNRSENAKQGREQAVRAEYTDFFSALGVTPEKSEELMAQLISIEQASKGANGALIDLAKVRAKYLDLLESAMTPEAIAAYEDYELAKPARRELDLLNSFLSDEQLAQLDANAEQVLLELFRDAQAFTTRTSFGPYDGSPRPAVGQRLILQRLEENLAEFQQARDLMLQEMTELQWPEEWLQLMNSYYDSRSQEKLNEIEYMRQPIEVRSAERLRRSQARIDAIQMDGNANKE